MLEKVCQANPELIIEETKTQLDWILEDLFVLKKAKENV